MILDVNQLRTPCYVLDEGLLERNLKIIADVRQRTGCRILLALKGFAMWSVFPLIRQYLSGVTASSLHEARLGREEFDKEVHLCAPAYRPDEYDELLHYADHMVFNSFSQWRHFQPWRPSAPQHLSYGLRVNPQHSEVKVPIYDPCAPASRLGITAAQFNGSSLEGISGLHFHTLCELNADSLERTLEAFESRFGAWLNDMQWVNFGGGHHITRDDYDLDLLCRLLHEFQTRYHVDVYLEPGEAVALNAGVLVASVLDIIHNDTDIAILDTSAAAHMPDVLEMPYRPVLDGAGQPGQYPCTYRLGGASCLAGDVIGDYSFPQPLTLGQKLIFHDMAHYTMVKNNTFNGIQLPDIVLYTPQTRQTRLIRHFTYEDYKHRLS